MAIPVITSITPTSGSVSGQTSVTVTGTGFTGTTAVSVGGKAATSFSVTNDTTLVVVTPNHVQGITDIIVTNATGPSVAGAGDKFTFSDDASAIVYYDKSAVKVLANGSQVLSDYVDPGKGEYWLGGTPPS